MVKSEYMVLAGGRIVCRRCQALSKATGQQCRSPAVNDKRVCRIHGGLSTGPRTPEGRARCGRKTHGNSTRQARAELSLELQRLAVIETIALRARLIDTPSRGRKPGWRKLA